MNEKSDCDVIIGVDVALGIKSDVTILPTRTVHPGIGEEPAVGARGRTVPAGGSRRMGRRCSTPAILKKFAQFAHRFED